MEGICILHDEVLFSLTVFLEMKEVWTKFSYVFSAWKNRKSLA